MPRPSISLRHSIPAILLLAGSVMGLVAFQRETSMAYSRSQQELTQQANFVGNQTAQLIEYLYAQSKQADLPLWFSQLSTAPHVNMAVLLDDQQRVIESTRLAWRDRSLPEIAQQNPDIAVELDQIQPQIQQVRQTQSGRTLTSENGQRLYALYPVGLAPQAGQILPARIGVLVIEYDLAGQNQRLYAGAVQHSLIYIACLAGSSLLLWVFFSQVVVIPLRRLTAAASQISAGNLSVQVRLDSANEIGSLARSFNHMVGQLREYFAALEATNAELESRVAERTAALASANRVLQRLAHIDGLTEIANRRRLDEFLATAWQQGQPLALVLCDVDFFKRYNDLYGHQQGDDCLRQVAQALLQAVPGPSDLVARYGGEEFAVVLTNASIQRAVALAERLRCAVHALQLPHQGSGIGEYVTLSVGAACLTPQANRSAAALIAAADAALYEAKQCGRNRSIVHMA